MLLTILLLALQAFAQTGYSGSAQYSGAAVRAGGGGQSFLGYTGQDIVPWPATIPSAGGASKTGVGIIYDTSYPSGTPARIARCTDRSWVVDQPNTQAVAGLGGSGVGVLFNTNDTVLHITTGTGSDAMVLFDPVNMVCSTAVTKDKNQTNPGSASTHADFGGGFFSLTDPTLWYSFGGGLTDGYMATQVVKYTFTSLTTGTYAVGPVVADFQYGFPSTVNTPAWANGTTYHFGEYVMVTLTEPDWQANKSDYVIGDIIVPTVNNSAGCAFKLVKTGTTGSSAPSWGSACNMNSRTDGSVSGMWKGLGGGASFIFQETGGTVGSTCTSMASGTPVFQGPDGHPDFFSTVVDNTCTWTNMGPALSGASVSWNAAGGVSLDSNRFAVATSTNSYGNFTDGWASGKQATDGGMTSGSAVLTSATIGWAAGDVGKTIYVRGAGAGGKYLASTIASYQSATQVTLADAAVTSVSGVQIESGANLNYIKYGGGQGTGNWNVMYDTSVNRYYLWNTATGINSQYTCSGGTGPQCTGGTWVYAVRGVLAPFAGGICAMNIHNLKLATACHQSVVTKQGDDLVIGANACPNFSVWDPDDSPFSSTLDVQDVGSLNHWTVRGCDVVGLNNSGYGSSSGVYMATHDLRNPSATPQIIWQVSPCSTTRDANGNFIPSACDLSKVIDNHLSGVFNPTGSDDKPICGDTYNYDTGLPVPTSAYQGEVTCTQSAAKWTNTAAPQTIVWRGPHHFNTQTNNSFSARFVLSQYSQTGKFVAFTSDWNNTLGSVDGTTPTLGTSPTGSIATGATCYGGWNWQQNHAYTAGTLIRPSTDLGGGGTLYPVFQAVVTGTSQGSSNPIGAIPGLFGGHNVGDTFTDGGVTWMEVAADDNCASDVFVAEVSKAGQ
jgi:hypothetical protein